MHFIRDDMCFFIDAAVRCFNETEFIHLTEAGKGRNQADIRAFRRFHGAHTAVVGVMHVADFKPGAFTGQAARPESTEAALMREFGQRIGLVHELGQLAGTEKFFNSRDDGTNIDKHLRRNRFRILYGHAFTNNSFHARQPDTELVLQEFTDTAKAPVAQMVDIVDIAEPVHQIEEIADIGNDIFLSNRTVINGQIAVIANNFTNGPVLLFGKDFDKTVETEDTAVFNFPNFGSADNRLSRHDKLARFPVDNRLMQGEAEKAMFPAELAAGFITADTSHIITAGVKEEPFKEAAGTFYCRRFAGTKFFIDFNQCFFLRFGSILFESGLQTGIIIEKLHNIVICGPTERTNQDGRGDLTISVDTGINNAVRIRFQFNPRPAVRYDRRTVEPNAHGIDFTAVIHAGRTYQLADNNTFRTVNDKCTRIRNQGEVTHEYFLVFDLTCFTIHQANKHTKRGRISRVPLFALANVIFRFT